MGVPGGKNAVIETLLRLSCPFPGQILPRPAGAVPDSEHRTGAGVTSRGDLSMGTRGLGEDLLGGNAVIRSPPPRTIKSLLTLCSLAW